MIKKRPLIVIKRAGILRPSETLSVVMESVFLSVAKSDVVVV
jgi:hypothetical protein